MIVVKRNLFCFQNVQKYIVVKSSTVTCTEECESVASHRRMEWLLGASCVHWRGGRMDSGACVPLSQTFRQRHKEKENSGERFGLLGRLLMQSSHLGRQQVSPWYKSLPPDSVNPLFQQGNSS